MSERLGHRGLLAAVMLGAVHVTPVPAQSITAERARVERLERQRVELARRIADASRGPVPTDTVRSGSLVVRSDRQHAALAREAAGRAAAVLDRAFGSWTARLVETPFDLRADSMRRFLGAARVAALRIANAEPARDAAPQWLEEPATAVAVADALVRRAS